MAERSREEQQQRDVVLLAVDVNGFIAQQTITAMERAGTRMRVVLVTTSGATRQIHGGHEEALAAAI
eukprot:6032360-Prorocentrum_lima.AAC.1